MANKNSKRLKKDFGLSASNISVRSAYSNFYQMEANFMDKSEEIQKLEYYFVGASTVGDYVEAVKALKKLSDLGDVDATNLLGTIYRFGKDGVEQDTKKALEYYTKGEAWSSIADIYYRGAPNIEPNIEESLKYCLQAVEKKDNDEFEMCKAMALLSLIYRDKFDIEESFKWFQRAFEQGDNFNFSDEEFFNCFLRDAQAGNVRSMLKLGHLEKMRDNKAKSAAWYKRALDWDNPENIYDAKSVRQIGDWYRTGNEFIPLEQDTEKAILWLERATDIFNDAESKEILYEIYRTFLYDF